MLSPDIGVSEMLIVAAVALIVVGPKDLPLLMRRVGQFIARLRGMASEFRASFDDMARQSELDELRKEVEAMRSGNFAGAADAQDAGVDQVFADIDQGLKTGNVSFSPAVQIEPEPEVAPKPARKPRAKPAAKTAAPAADKPARKRASAPAIDWNGRVIDDEAEIEASRAPLLDHLIELRTRLIVCIVALLIGFGICFYFADPIFMFLVEPFSSAQNLLASQKAAGDHHGYFDLILVLLGQKEVAVAPDAEKLKLIYTAALEFFFTKLKVAGFG
eukprot:gene18627-18496_t